MQTRSTTWLALLAAAALMAGGCGDDDSNGTGPGSGNGSVDEATVPDHAGVNAPITAANAEQVMMEVSTGLNQAFTRLMQVAASGKGAGVPAPAAKSIADEQIQGLMSGTLTITSGELNLGQEVQSMNAEFVFDDFSDGGEIYIGGTIQIDFQSSMNANSGEMAISLTQTGALAFSGKYKGTLGIDLSVEMGATGSPAISGTVTIDGETVNLDALTAP